MRPPAPADSNQHGNSGDSSGASMACGDEEGMVAEPVEQAVMHGVRQYEPEHGELVVLLSAKIAGKPAVGAELLVVARDDDNNITLQLPDGWEQLLMPA